MRSVQKKIYSDLRRCRNKPIFITTCDLHGLCTKWKDRRCQRTFSCQIWFAILENCLYRDIWWRIFNMAASFSRDKIFGGIRQEWRSIFSSCVGAAWCCVAGLFRSRASGNSWRSLAAAGCNGNSGSREWTGALLLADIKQLIGEWMTGIGGICGWMCCVELSWEAEALEGV